MPKRASRITTASIKGSKQPTPPATLMRGGGLTNLFTRYGLLTTPQMRALADRQIAPGVCRSTLLHQVTGLEWAITDSTGEDIRSTKEGRFWYSLFDNAASSGGFRMGFHTFLDRFAEDILTAREGGNIEVVRDAGGVPIQLLNIDAQTLKFTGDSDYPFIQKVPWGEESPPLEYTRVLHAAWHPFVEIGQELSNRTPIQMAYTAIAILAASDEYNYNLLTDVVPLGILNLGPGFDEERAKLWKAAWDADMQAANPSRIGLLYGTDKVSWTRLSTLLQDMAFESTSYWYTALVAACFEMSILDISILTRVSTRAAAEAQWAQSRRQGLRKLMQVIKHSFEYYVLPEGLFWTWEDIDITDDATRARINRDRAITLATLVSLAILSPEQALMEAQKHKIVSDEHQWQGPLAPPNEGEGSEGGEAGGATGRKTGRPIEPKLATQQLVYKTSEDKHGQEQEDYAGEGCTGGDDPAGQDNHHTIVGSADSDVDMPPMSEHC